MAVLVPSTPPPFAVFPWNGLKASKTYSIPHLAKYPERRKAGLVPLPPPPVYAFFPERGGQKHEA